MTKEEYNRLHRIVFGGGHFTKSYKEECIRSMRQYEREHGLEGRSYNGGSHD